MKLEWRKYDILGKWGTPRGTWSHVRPSLSQLQTWTTRSNPAYHRTSTSETRYNSLYITSGTEARSNLAYHSIMSSSRNIMYLNNSTAKIQALLMIYQVIIHCVVFSDTVSVRAHAIASIWPFGKCASVFSPTHKTYCCCPCLIWFSESMQISIYNCQFPTLSQCNAGPPTNSIFIGPRSDHSLPMSVTDWLTKGRGQRKKNVFFWALPQRWGGGSTHARIFWPSFNKCIFGQ